MLKEELAMAFKKKWPGWLILGILVLLSGYQAAGEFYKWFKLESEYKSVTKAIILTEQETRKLKSELENSSSPQALEKEVKSRLNSKKEGELVLVVMSENNFPEEDFLNQEKNNPIAATAGIWFNLQQWRRFFFP